MSEYFLEQEIAEFREAFSNDAEVTFGDAHLTVAERRGLTDLRRGSRTHADFVEQLWAKGYPFPDETGADEIGNAGRHHACVVAEHLLVTRGKKANRMTVWSYEVKNAADRQIYHVMKKNGVFARAVGDRLRSEFLDSRRRDPNHSNPNVKYPEVVDDSKIHGVANVHRYWPAQLMRYMEAVRLGILSDSERESLQIDDTVDISLYKFDWRDPWLSEALKDIKDIQDVPVNIFRSVVEEFRSRGLPDEKIAALMLVGYSPGGPISEHGNIPEVTEIWGKILYSYHGDPLFNFLLTGVSKKLAAVVDSEKLYDDTRRGSFVFTSDWEDVREGVRCRTFKIGDISVEFVDGAYIEMKPGARTPIQRVETEHVFWETPYSGHFIFLHVDSDGKVSVREIDSNRGPGPKPISVKKGEIMCWYCIEPAEDEVVGKILETEMPGFVLAKLAEVQLVDDQLSPQFIDIITKLEAGEIDQVLAMVE